MTEVHGINTGIEQVGYTDVDALLDILDGNHECYDKRTPGTPVLAVRTYKADCPGRERY